MIITTKNRAKFRRGVQEGDKLVFTGNGEHATFHYQGTVTYPGSRLEGGVMTVMPGGISGALVAIDYDRVVEWFPNTTRS